MLVQIQYLYENLMLYMLLEKQMKEFERYGVFEIVSLSAWLYSLCEKVIIMNITALVWSKQGVGKES